MDFMKKINKRFPILLSLVFVGVFYWILRLGSFTADLMPTDAPEYQRELIYEFIAAALTFGILMFIGNGYIFTRKKTPFFKGLLPGLMFIVISTSNLMMQLSTAIENGDKFQSPLNILCYVLTMALVGVTEEFAFRGIIAESIFNKYGQSPAGIWFSVIVSGCIFGFFHLWNLGTVGQTESTLVQCIFASILCMLLCAVYYRTKNIWVTVFIHAYLDFCSLISTGIFASNTISDIMQSYSLLQVYAALPYLGMCFLILRPPKLREICLGQRPSTDKEKLLTAITAITLGLAMAIICAFLLPYTLESLMETIGGMETI